MPPRFRLGVVPLVLLFVLSPQLPSAQASGVPPAAGVPGSSRSQVSGLRPALTFTAPQAAVAEAPTTATLALDGPAGRYFVPYIQTAADLPVALAHNSPPDRTIIDVVLDAATPQARSVRLTSAPWQTTFQGLGFGEHTLTAHLYVPEEGVPAEIALQAPPAASAHLEQVARGDVVAALGDSTTEGLGEGPWQPGDRELLGFFPDWLAAARSLSGPRPGWLTADGRNFPQSGMTMHPASRPAFTVELAAELEAERHHPVLVLNDGWSGTTSEGYKRISTSDYFARQMATARPNAWLINLGANDPLVNRSPAEYASWLGGLVGNLEQLYGASASSIHLACPIYATQPQRNRVEAQYLPVVDALRVQGHLGAAPNFFAFFRDHPEEVADAVHPNFAGYTAMAQLWRAALAGQGQGCAS